MRFLGSVLTASILAATGLGCSPGTTPGERAVGKGNYAEAATLLREELPESSDSVQTETLLAYSLAMSGDTNGADAAFQSAKDEAADAEDKIFVHVYEGLVAVERGDFERGQEMLHTAESVLKENGEGRSLLFGLVLGAKGVIAAANGNHVDAERMLAQAAPIVRRHRSEEPAKYAEIATNLATVLVSRGAFAGARPHYEQAIAALERANADECLTMANALNGLAYAEYQEGDYGEAEEHLNRAAALYDRIEGAESLNVAKCLHDLAKVYQFAEKPEDAEEAFQQSLRACRKAVGDEHGFTVQVRESYAAFLRDTDRASEADKLLGLEVSAEGA